MGERIKFGVCVSLDSLCRWQFQVSVYCAWRIPAHLRCTQCSILLHLMDICFLTCVCLWQISQIQTYLFKVVRPGLASTSPAFVSSSASHPAGPHAKKASKSGPHCWGREGSTQFAQQFESAVTAPPLVGCVVWSRCSWVITYNLEDVYKQATACYDKKMSEMRIQIWAAKNGKGVMSSPKLYSLPPTTEAFHENVKCVHYQGILWRSLEDNDLLPEDKASAPEYVLKLMKYRCSTYRPCATRCTCKYVIHLPCTMLCACYSTGSSRAD